METPRPRLIDDLRPPAEEDFVYRPASVLLLMYPRAGEEYVVFMRRPDTMLHHRGQISLPGGAQDPTDPDPVFTALREAREELGIDPEQVDVLGTMPPVYARVSSFVITPVVAQLKAGAGGNEGGIVFEPSSFEVAEVIEVPLRVLRDPAAHRMEQRTAGEFVYNVHFYTYGPYEIWGATGRIIYEFVNSGRW